MTVSPRTRRRTALAAVLAAVLTGGGAVAAGAATPGPSTPATSAPGQDERDGAGRKAARPPGQDRRGGTGPWPRVTGPAFVCDPALSHGQNVSAYARSLPRGPGRGRLVSQAARSDCGKPSTGD